MAAEAARGALQQLPGARVLTELRHRDAAQRERRRIVAERNAVERLKRIAHRERSRGGGDHGVHDARVLRLGSDRVRSIYVAEPSCFLADVYNTPECPPSTLMQLPVT